MIFSPVSAAATARPYNEKSEEILILTRLYPTLEVWLCDWAPPDSPTSSGFTV